MTSKNIASKWEKQRKKLASFAKKLPDFPGVYLMHDCFGNMLYIGKANSLRKRVSSYFLVSTDIGPWKQGMLPLIECIEFIECETEWEALLLEARLIKDHRPKYNSLQLDGKTYPYLAVTMKDDYPGVFITRSPSDDAFKGAKLFGPFTSSGALNRSIHMLQTVFKFRTCPLVIKEEDPSNNYFRPCLLHAIRRCSGPCANKINKEAYRKDIEGFLRLLTSKRSVMLRELQSKMDTTSQDKKYEEAAIIRDQIIALEKLDNRADNKVIWQSEVTVFAKDPSAGLQALQKALQVNMELRYIECFDIAHLQGGETVGAKVTFMDGKPYKDGYRRYKIQTAKNDDYMSMREVISRRFRDAGKGMALYPDLIVIDGGRGQLSAAMEAFDQLEQRPPLVISLAKKEELIFLTKTSEPIKLSRNNEGLKLVQAIRDEAHRFAQHYHHHLRTKKTFGES
ncbi:MAG: excinuclease ABC subunit UvrC [Phycisphaerales bacterium]|nr:excinuclease ABC subunit UvrC [Planctomycetota bacterium]MBL6997275.1 excinuclease ABC subunit UvrC [Phycisphaerales bacterium]